MIVPEFHSGTIALVEGSTAPFCFINVLFSVYHSLEIWFCLYEICKLKRRPWLEEGKKETYQLFPQGPWGHCSLVSEIVHVVQKSEKLFWQPEFLLLGIFYWALNSTNPSDQVQACNSVQLGCECTHTHTRTYTQAHPHTFYHPANYSIL